MKIALPLLVLIAMSCRGRPSSNLSDVTTNREVTISDFDYKMNDDLLMALAKRVGCDEASRWVLSSDVSLPALIKNLGEQRVPYDYLKKNLFDPTIAQRRCSGVASRNEGSPLEGVNALLDLVESKGFHLTIAMIGGLGSHLTEDGALHLSRKAWEKNYPDGKRLRVARIECTPNSYSTDERCMDSVFKQLNALDVKDPKKKHLYLLWGYSKGGNTILHALPKWPNVRERTLAVVTSGSPIGGGLPIRYVRSLLEPLKDKVDSISLQDRLMLQGLMMLGAASSSEEAKAVAKFEQLFRGDEFEHMLEGMKSIQPPERYEYLRSTLAGKDYTRVSNHPMTGDRNIPVFHISGAADVAEFRAVPSPKIDASGSIGVAADSVNYMQLAELSLINEFKKHPLADACVALEHSVIPRFAVPKGLAPKLIGLLKVDHMSIGFSVPPGPNNIPSEAMTDAVLEVVANSLRGGK